MSKEKGLRLIIDEPRGGVENMAVDESILLAVHEGQSVATLRLYRWVEPTISLGYFQPYKEFLSQDPEIRNLPMVRRQTGGGAILHDDEITYSLVLPIRDTDITTDITDLYRLVHDAVIAVLAQRGVSVEYRGGRESGNSQRGPFFCFAREHRLDLVLQGEKLLGSAQRRMKQAVLQHGSLILGRHFAQQPSAQLKSAIESPSELDTLPENIAEQIRRQLNLNIEVDEITDWENDRIPGLIEKYGSQEWSRQR